MACLHQRTSMLWRLQLHFWPSWKLCHAEDNSKTHTFASFFNEKNNSESKTVHLQQPSSLFLFIHQENSYQSCLSADTAITIIDYKQSLFIYFRSPSSVKKKTRGEMRRALCLNPKSLPSRRTAQEYYRSEFSSPLFGGLFLIIFTRASSE